MPQKTARNDAEENAHYRRLEFLYAKAPVTRLYRSMLKVARGSAEVIVPVDGRFFHGGGALHGSVYFRALDDAAFFAANSVVLDVLVLTASFQIDFFRPVDSGSLRATGRLVHEGRTRLIASAELRSEDGTAVAVGTGTFMRSGLRIDELVV